MMDITGSCHCGAINYGAKIDPGRVTVCHCTDCQQLPGSAYRVTTAGRREDFHLLSGAPKAYSKQGESGAVSQQYFCPHCGSHLYRTADDDDRIGCIDQRASLPATRQIWCRSALAWTGDIGKLPQCNKE